MNILGVRTKLVLWKRIRLLVVGAGLFGLLQQTKGVARIFFVLVAGLNRRKLFNTAICVVLHI
jgi:hypothetical protein